MKASPPNAGSFDPCALLSAEEVEAAVGWKPVAVEPHAQGDMGGCRFKGPEAALGQMPNQVEVGIRLCPTNMPCTELPDFKTSAEMAQCRHKGYEGTTWADLDAAIVAIEGLGIPAIEHELGGLRAIEMQIGHNRLAYVTAWSASEPTRALADKVLARIHR